MNAVVSGAFFRSNLNDMVKNISDFTYSTPKEDHDMNMVVAFPVRIRDEVSRNTGQVTKRNYISMMFQHLDEPTVAA